MHSRLQSQQPRRSLQLDASRCFFWATHADAELDLLALYRGKRLGFEFKRTDTPGLTRSMHIARDDLRLDHLYVVMPGKAVFPLGEGISALGLESIASLR